MAGVERGQAPGAFLDLLPHHLRHRDTMAVRGEAIRGRFDQRRRVLVRRLKAFIYDRDKVYTTRVVESET